MPETWLRSSARHARLLEVHACFEALLCVAVVSNSKIATAAWGALCLAASYSAWLGNPGCARAAIARSTVLAALAWGSWPIVVSVVSDYCGSCTPPRRGWFDSSPLTLLSVYCSAAATAALLYTLLLRHIARRRPLSAWQKRLVEWPVLFLHFGAGLTPAKGVNAKLIAPVLFLACVAGTLAWRYGFEEEAFDGCESFEA